MFSRIVVQTTQPLTILDWRDDSGLTDRLFLQSDRSKGCTRNRCTGSKVGTLQYNSVPYCHYNLSMLICCR